MSVAGGLLLVAVSYFAGAIPWGVVLGKLFSDTDLREHGSKSTGATNAYRVLGWQISVSVLVLDFVKGFLPVVLARWLDAPSWVVGSVAVAAVVGHCWSVFIGFGGGKGVATGSGALVAMFPIVLVVLPVMVIVVATTRFVSLASIVGSILAAVLAVILVIAGEQPAAIGIASVAIAAIIVYRHRSNIERLRNGTERRFARPSATT
jgi:acyl phosphate:glycerol-3-phosphate acyltransferase